MVFLSKDTPLSQGYDYLDYQHLHSLCKLITLMHSIIFSPYPSNLSFWSLKANGDSENSLAYGIYESNCGENLTPCGLPLCTSRIFRRLSRYEVRSVPGAETTWGTRIQHLLIVSGRNLCEGLEEITGCECQGCGCWCRGKGQPGCRFGLNYWLCSERGRRRCRWSLADTTIASFQKETLTERKKESSQSLCFSSAITPWLLVALQKFWRIPWWWVILQVPCWPD